MVGESIICFNGVFVPAGTPVLSCLDGGFLYGQGLFETLKVKDGMVLELKGHLSRLEASGAELRLPLAFGKDEMAQMVQQTVRRNGVNLGVVRITATSGPQGGSPALLIQTRPFPYQASHYTRGFRAGLSRYVRNPHSPLVRHKTINYWENIMARREAAQEGLDEAIFLNTRGYLAEGSVSNIFFVLGDTVITPPVETGLLGGMARANILDICSHLGLKAQEKNIHPGEMSLYQECFITNSLLGVMPVIGIHMGSGNVCRFLQRKVTNIIRAKYEAYEAGAGV